MRVLAVFLVLVGCSVRPEPDDPSQYVLAVLDDEGPVCGAVQVDRDRAITAHHCVAENGEPAGGRPVRLERRDDYWAGIHVESETAVVSGELVVRINEELLDGLAVLRTEPQESWAHVAWRPAPGSSEVRIWHHGLGHGWSYEETVLEPVPLAGFPVGGAWTEGLPGMSGCPVMDEHDRVLGVIILGGEERAVYLDTRVIRKAMER